MITELLYNKLVIEIKKPYKDYLEERKNENGCEEHGLVRYHEGLFVGCFLCPKDKEIQDKIMQLNITNLTDKELGEADG